MKTKLLACLLIVSIPSIAWCSNRDFDLQRDVGIDQKPGARVPLDLQFRDSSGDRVTLGDCFDGKPVILNLVYFECPMLCNLTQDGLMRTLSTMKFSAGKEFSVLTVSFDPHESPALASRRRKITLSRYARPGAENGWRFLTGDQAEIRQLTDAVGFRYAWDDQRGRFAHAAGIVILTPDGRVSRYLNGVEFESRDIRLALVEASQRRIGTRSDQVLLFCYQYDPTTGRYGLAIMNIIRTFGALTVLALAVGIVILKRRESRANQVPPVSAHNGIAEA